MRQRYLILLINLLLFCTMAGFTAKLHAAPPPPPNTVMIRPGDSIALHASTNAAAFYQWFKDGLAITNANTKDYFAKQPGSYTVIAYNKDDCPSAISEPIVVVIGPNLYITADNKTRPYASPNPALTFSYSGFLNGDTPASLTTQPVIKTTGTITSNAGTYPIALSGASSPKYVIIYRDATLTVTKVPLIIKANNDAKFKDGKPYVPGNGVVYTGFVNGESTSVLKGNLGYTGPATGAVNAGQYSIIPTGFTADNYQITYLPGILTITDKTVDMSVLKVSETRSVRVGETFNYTLTVENKSTIAATQVQLKDALPPELDFVTIASTTSGSAVYDNNSRTITWTLGNVAPKGKAILTLQVKANTHGTVVNSATVTSAEDDSNTANNKSTDAKEIDGIYIPNVFTPNNDGKNDTFVIPNLNFFPDNEITIFNRWGNVVYQKKGYQSDWTAPGLNEGTYFYILKVNSNNKSDIYKGYVTVLRSSVMK